MRILLFITLFLSSYIAFGQGLEPSQIQGAPKLNDILQAKNMYIDEYGDTLYIYQHTSLDGLITSTDSIYLRNDTIFLKNGSGFVKIPKLKAGQTTTIQTLITAGDTIYAEVNTNSLDSTHIKVGSVARNDLSFAIDESKWEQSGSNLFPKILSSNVGIGTNNPDGNLGIYNSTSNQKLSFNRIGGWHQSEITSYYDSFTNKGLRLGGNDLYGQTTMPNVLTINNYNQNGGGRVGIEVDNPLARLNINVPYFESSDDGIRLDNNDVSIISQINNDGDGIYRSTSGHFSFGSISNSIQSLNPNANIHLYAPANVGSTDLFKLERSGGYGSSVLRQFYTSFTNWGTNIGSGINLDNYITINNALQRVGINKTDPSATLHVGGDLIIDSRVGAAFSGLGVTTGGKIVDLGYLPISNYQIISSTGAAGNITLSNGGGTLNLNVNDADYIPTNEIDVLRVGTSVTGGGRLQNQTQGFPQASEIGLVITGATASVSSGINGSITWTLPDASSFNEIQNISFGTKTGSTTPLNIDGATGVNLVNGTAINISRDAANQITFSVPNGSITPSLLDRSYLTSFTEVDGLVTNEGQMTLNTNVANTNYTFSSNTSLSTPLILNAGTGITIPRSINQLTFSLTNTGVTAGSYSNPTITIDAQGRISSASSGSGGGLTAANNGLSISSTTVQLGNVSGGSGAELLSNREIPTNGYNLVMSGTGRLGVGRTSSPLAYIHAGSSNSNGSEDAKILVSENVTNTSLFSSHGFADASTVSFGKSYNAFDSRWILNSTVGGSGPHGVCFQSAPTITSLGSVANYYSLYGGITNSGTIGTYSVVRAIGISGNSPTNYYGLNLSSIIASGDASAVIASSITANNAYGININGVNGTTLSRGVSITNVSGGTSRSIYAQGVTELYNSQSGDIDALMLTRGGVNAGDELGIVFEAGAPSTRYYSGRIKSGFDGSLRGDFTFEINTSGGSGLGSLATGAQLKTSGIFSTLAGFQVNNIATSGSFLKGNGTAYVAGYVNPSDIQQGGASTNQVLQWNGSSWGPSTISSGGITSLNGLTAASQTFQYSTSGVYPSWNSSGSIHTFRLPAGLDGEVLKHNGTGWTYGTDNVGPTYTAGTGITLPSNAITLTNTGVTAASYTNANITVDAQGRITSASNGSGGGSGTVTSITATSPLTGGTITTTGNIGIQNATTAQSGALTSTDWNTFNNKVGGSGSNDRVAYWSGTNNITSSSSFTYDGVLNLFGASGTGNTDLMKLEKSGGFGGTTFQQFYTSGSNWGLKIKEPFDYGDQTQIYINHSDNFVGIGNSAPSAKLHVQGNFMVNTRTGTASTIAGWTSTGIAVDAAVRTVNGQSILGSGDISSTNIYNSNGTLTGNRTVTMASNTISFQGVTGANTSDFSLSTGTYPTLTHYITQSSWNSVLSHSTVENQGFLTQTSNGFGIANNDVMSGMFRLRYGTGEVQRGLAVYSNRSEIRQDNTYIDARPSSLEISINNNNGDNNQVLTSNGTNTTWQNNPALDNIYQEGGPSSLSWADGADGAVFSGASDQYASVSSSTTWTKSSSSAVYRVELVMSTTNATEYPRIALVRSGSVTLGQMRIYNNLSSPLVNDMSFVFVTDANAGNLTFRNTTGNTITANIKRIIITRLR